MPATDCTVCDFVDTRPRPRITKGMCRSCYSRWKRHGDPRAGQAKRGAHAAFVASALDGTAPREANGCILWPFPVDRNGYARTSVQPGIPERTVGRVILTETVGPPAEGLVMRHVAHDVCGNRHCIAPEHLRWGTPAENAADRSADGTLLGKRNGMAKLTDDDVRAIRRRFIPGRPGRPKADGTGRSNAAELADEFGVSISQITRICTGKSRR